MHTMDYATTLSALQAEHEEHPLSILSLSLPVVNAAQLHAQSSPSKRTSNVSNSNSDISDPTPATLLADLTHYKDLFSKLRFSYLEQVTKEKYLRSIVGDPPLLVNHKENVELEEKLAVVKAELKEKKVEVDQLVEEMEDTARELAGRWEGVQEQMAELENLPGKVQNLEDTIAQLQAQLSEREGLEPRSSDPRQNLSLDETNALIAGQKERAKELDRQIAAIQRALPAKMRECEVVEGELEGFERRRNEAAQQASEARRIKEEGGRDELEEKGRWYRSAEVVMRGMGVGVDA